MKIGLIVYSQTGNTLQVAETLQKALVSAGHDAQLERITVADANFKSTEMPVFTNTPDVSAYDMLYMAAPVQGFSLCRAMKAYLAQLDTLAQKPVACFVTQFFPKAWMGGKNAVKQMCEEIAHKGGEIVATGVINWSNKQKDAQIEQLVKDLVSASPVNL